MPLTVETGTGSTTADSYGATTTVDTYNENFVGSTDWMAAATPARERACRQATQFLDVNYEGQWRGVKASSDQALSWPRSSVYTRDGYLVADDALPTQLTQAFCELAIRAVTEELMPDVAVEENGAVIEEEIRVGSILTRTQYAGGKGTSASYPRIDAILGQLLKGGGLVERG